MKKHQALLDSIVAELIAMDADCSILVLGGLARGEARDDSDIDLMVGLSSEPGKYTDLIREDNKGKMRHDAVRDGITIDIGWHLLDQFLERVPDDAPLAGYPFLLGRILRDPSGTFAKWLTGIESWMNERQWLRELWDNQLQAMRRHKLDPSYPLPYKEQEFYTYLRGLVAERGSPTTASTATNESAAGGSI